MIPSNPQVQTIRELDPAQKKWKILYPAYIDSTKKIDQGNHTKPILFSEIS